MTESPKEFKPPGWMTKDSLQNSLRCGLHDDTLTIKNLIIKPAVSVGENYGSLLLRATFDLSKDERTSELSVVIKILPTGDMAVKAMRNTGIFNKERSMFSTTLPQMHKLLEEAQPGISPRLYAKCYYSQGPPNDIMIFEDLCASGFRLADRFKGFDLEHSLFVVESLGRLHASSFVLTKKKPEIIEQYRDSLYTPPFAHLFSKFLEDALLALADQFETESDFSKHYSNKLRDIQKEIVERMFKAYERDESKINVILHGDAWINNMMFKYDEDKVVAMKFVDFQMANYNSPVLDLHYFIFTSPKQEIREKYLEDILRKYHYSFMNTLHFLNCNVDYSFDEFKKEFFDRITYGFVSALLVLPVMFLLPEEAPDMDEMFDSEEGYKNKAIFRGIQFTNIIKHLLPFFERHGVFRD